MQYTLASKLAERPSGRALGDGRAKQLINMQLALQCTWERLIVLVVSSAAIDCRFVFGLYTV